jgi:glycosyltransferase involved in cell wall biosynthesis
MASMKPVPAVTVVLPTYNRAQEIRLSIQSVLSQSFSNFELIIVDDASTDNTQDVVRQFNDPRIRFIRSNIRVGGGEARNIGIRQANASLVAFQDSDDEWRCHKLEMCLSVLDLDDTLDGVYSGFWKVDKRRVTYMPRFSTRMESSATVHEKLLTGNFIATPTAVVRTRALKRIDGFDSQMPRYQDWDLFLRLSQYGHFGFIEEPLILAHSTGNSISTSAVAHRDALIRLCEKNAEAINRNKRLKAYWLKHIGDAKLAVGESGSGQRDLIEAMRLRPLDLRYGAKVLLAKTGSAAFYTRLMRVLRMPSR